MMKIEEIQIKGLFGKKDICWKLRPQVNVLVGENGSGKSTILDIVYAYYTKKPTSKILNLTFNSSLKFSDTIIHFNFKNEGQVYEDLVQRLKYNLGVEVFEELKAKDPIFLELLDNNKPQYQFYETVFGNRKGVLRELENYISITRISSHINEIHANMELGLRTRTEKNNRLDIEIQDIVNELKKMNNEELMLCLKNTLNMFFNKIDKNIDFDKNNELIYLDKKEQKQLNYSYLSSGERQLIYILLRVALSNADKNKTAIILMDEPEISFHLDWQEHFIKQLTILNPDAQFIIVTHSPALIMDGWNDVYTDMEEITTWL